MSDASDAPKNPSRFFSQFNAAYDDGHLAKLTKQQLIALWGMFRHGDADLVSFQSNARLAEKMGHASTSHARRARKGLIDAGLVDRVSTGGSGKGDTSRFKINICRSAGQAQVGQIGASSSDRPLSCADQAQVCRIGTGVPDRPLRCADQAQGTCADQASLGAPIRPTEGLINRPLEQTKEQTIGSAVIFPPVLDVPEFLEAWGRWEKHRREIRKRLTPSTTQKQLAKLAAMGSADAAASINQSIEQGWTGLFELKGNRNDRNNRTNRKPGEFDERLDVSAVVV